MKHKKGDRVKAQPYEWYMSRKDKQGNVNCIGATFLSTQRKLCGEVMIVEEVFDKFLPYYKMEGNTFMWTDEMLSW